MAKGNAFKHKLSAFQSKKTHMDTLSCLHYALFLPNRGKNPRWETRKMMIWGQYFREVSAGPGPSF